MLFFSYLLLYWSYLVFPFLFFIIYRLFKNKKFTKPWVIFFILSIFFIYIRFVEPNIILTKEEEIEVWFNANFLVISDLHLWFFKNKYFLEKIISKINNFEDIDAVLIPWDFLYNLKSNTDLNNLFSPFKKLKYPVYATLGNHDDWFPWPYMTDKLIIALKNNNVVLLQNEAKRLKNKNVILLWLWDYTEWEKHVWLLKKFKKNDNLVVITHTPDTVIYYDSNDIPDITITGHTHGWQMRVPFLYKHVIPCKWDFDEWFYNLFWNKIFVSSWLWEVWLPFRLAIPPTIYKIKLN